MKVRDETVRVFDSVEKADEANRRENLERSGEERVRVLTAIVCGANGRSKPRLSGSYRILHVPPR